MNTERPDALGLEDLAVGDTFQSAPLTLARDALKDFAAQFDPQPFHLDEDAATDTLFQGLAASGWHTAALTMRLMASCVPIVNGLIGAGCEIAWPRPTRPDDTLHVSVTVAAIAPSRSRPERGIVTLAVDTLNQDEQCVQRMSVKIVVFRRVPS